MKILVVDDTITLRRILVNALKKAGFRTVREASNGIDALALMADMDLVITDWNMPEMDGLTLVREIRKNPVFGEIPIIMLVDVSVELGVLEALDAGVNDFLIRPFTDEKLIEKVQFNLPKGK